MKRVIIIAACLLAAAPALGAGMFGGPPEPGKMPSRFVRFDGVDMGPWMTPIDVPVGLPPVLFEVARVTVVLNHVRLGASFVKEFSGDFWSGNMVFPLRVGYTLFSAPRKTCLFWSDLADVYLEATGSLLASGSGSLFGGLKPGFTLALCGEAEYYGLGARLEVGWADIHADIDVGPWKMSRVSFFYVGLQLRFVTFGIGF